MNLFDETGVNLGGGAKGFRVYDDQGHLVGLATGTGGPGTPGVSIQWLGIFSSAPSSPTLNQAYRNSTDKKAYVWDGSAWQEMVEDGVNGISIHWLGTFSSAPGSPTLNQAYRNSTDKKAYIWNGTAWTEIVEDGAAATISIGSVVTLPPGYFAAVSNSGTPEAAILDFQIPTGADGAPGTPGAAATVAVGGVTTLAPGSSATVANGGTSSAAVLNFGIPQGAPGTPGSPGAAGPNVRSMVLCSAYTPPATGGDSAEVTVPYASDGSTVVTWNVKRISLRVATAGGAPSVTVEKSIGAGVFSAVTVGTITLSSGGYEASVTASLGTVQSGDKLRFNPAVLGTAANWTVVVELSTL